MNDTPTPVQRRNTGQGWLMLFGFAAVAAFALRTIANSAFWIHLATGRWIVEHGLPRNDVFAFTTAPGQPWIHDTWLYDLLLFGLWQLGAAPLVVFAHAAMAVTAFALLVPLARTWSQSAGITAALATSACIMAPLIDVAPHTFCYFLPALFLTTCGSQRSARQMAFVLVPAQVFWTNLHTSFVLGPLIVAAFTVEAWLAGSRPPAEGMAPAPVRDWRPLAILTAAIAVVTLVNPSGPALWPHVVSTFQQGYLTLKGATAPFTVHYTWSLWGYTVTGALVVIAAGFISFKGRLPLAITAIAVVSAFVMVRSPRYLDICAILAFPFLALCFSAVGAFLAARTRLHAAVLRGIAAVAALALCGAVIAAATSNYFYNRSGSATSFGWNVQPEVFPSERAIRILDELGTNHVIHLAADGDYLAWRRPDHKVFIDSRAALYDDSFRFGYQRALSGDPQAMNTLEDAYKPAAILLNGMWPGTALAMRHLLMSGRWKLAYFDGLSAILVLPSPAFRSLLTDDAMKADGLSELEASHKAFRKRVEEQRFPAACAPLIGAAFVYQSLASPRESAALFELLTRGAPTMTVGQVNHGIALVQSGRFEEAAAVLETAAAKLPRDTVVWVWLGKARRGMGREEAAREAETRARAINPELADRMLSTNAPGGPR